MLNGMGRKGVSRTASLGRQAVQGVVALAHGADLAAERKGGRGARWHLSLLVRLSASPNSTACGLQACYSRAAQPGCCGLDCPPRVIVEDVEDGRNNDRGETKITGGRSTMMAMTSTPQSPQGSALRI